LLSEIQFDIVKIDLSLVQAASFTIRRTRCAPIQRLASRWQATTVAEGVETAEQLAAIRDLGITTGQGYLLGRPARDRRVKPIDIESLLPQGWVELADDPAA
jgi:EAL domain-containing protein (putative c-di-GMP-specific phosphodiesterase class I)